MTIETRVERLAALVLILTCLSHIAAPTAWVRLFAAVRAQGEPAGLINAAIHLPLGLMIAAFHPVWSWPGIVVTVVGWSLVAKGASHLALPSWHSAHCIRSTSRRARGAFESPAS